MDQQIEKMIKEADQEQYRCTHCEALTCDCDTEPGEPDGI